MFILEDLVPLIAINMYAISFVGPKLHQIFTCEGKTRFQNSFQGGNPNRWGSRRIRL